MLDRSCEGKDISICRSADVTSRLKGGSTAGVCMAHLELSHGLLNGSLGIHTMHVVQVNVIGVQPFQRGFTCFPVSKSTCQQRCIDLWQEHQSFILVETRAAGCKEWVYRYDMWSTPDVFSAAIHCHAALACKLDCKLCAQLDLVSFPFQCTPCAS